MVMSSSFNFYLTSLNRSEPPSSATADIGSSICPRHFTSPEISDIRRSTVE